MATVTGPLLSIGASGSIAKTQVYSKWKGRPYVRQHVIPANPRSTDQTTTRNAFAWLNSVWKVSPAEFQEAWTAFASGKVLTNRNAFIQQNLPLLRGQTDLDGMVMSPGAKGGLAGSFVVTPGSAQLSITATPPTVLPAGWTVLEAIFAIIKDQSPETGTAFVVQAATDASSPYTAVFTGLGATTTWAAAAWFKYQTSSLATSLAYGPADATLHTTT
jgi:hypothetical protein